MPLLNPGRKAAAFSSPDQTGTLRTLAEFKGRSVVLYFYPKDDTPGCTVEACSFRDGWAKLRKAGIEVLGVSPDGTASHVKFIKKYKLPFALLADEPAAGKAPKVCTAYGTWQEKINVRQEVHGRCAHHLPDWSGRQSGRTLRQGQARRPR